MSDNVLLDKSFTFAIKIVNTFKELLRLLISIIKSSKTRKLQ